jgi:hypothetical protein
LSSRIVLVVRINKRTGLVERPSDSSQVPTFSLLSSFVRTKAQTRAVSSSLSPTSTPHHPTQPREPTHVEGPTVNTPLRLSPTGTKRRLSSSLHSRLALVSRTHLSHFPRLRSPCVVVWLWLFGCLRSVATWLSSTASFPCFFQSALRFISVDHIPSMGGVTAPGEEPAHAGNDAPGHSTPPIAG